MVFTVLALGVRGGGTYSWDRSLVEYFDRHYYDFELVHELSKAVVKGSIGLGVVVAAGLLAAFAAAGEMRRAAFWGLTIAGALAFTRVFKEILERPEIGVHQREYSFPSGNAACTTAGILALLFLLPPSRLRAILAAAGAVVLPLYGVALVLLLWHWPSDIVAGWALAVAWVLVLRLAFGEVSGRLPLRRLRRHPIERSTGQA